MQIKIKFKKTIYIMGTSAMEGLFQKVGKKSLHCHGFSILHIED